MEIEFVVLEFTITINVTNDYGVIKHAQSEPSFHHQTSRQGAPKQSLSNPL